MTDPILAELVVGCLLKDVVRLDADRRDGIGVQRLLEEVYGIGGMLAARIADEGETPENWEPDCPAHIARYIDSAYLQLPERQVWRALRTPFSAEDGEQGRNWYDPAGICFSEKVYYPEQGEKEVPADVLDRLCRTVSAFVRVNCGKTGFVHGLIDLLEDQGTFLSPDGGKHSLFETAKLRAGLACCVYQCLRERRITDYPAWFALPDEQKTACVLVCSLDFLGIKDFKFQQAFSDCLSGITAASFYIDLFRENVLDDLMAAAGLSRCNLVFSGGRHLHLFLPNTDCMKRLVAEQMRRVNDFLAERFQLDLYVSYGMHEARNLDRYGSLDGSCYLDIFTKIANQKALIEARKYSADNLIRMNRSLSGGEDQTKLRQQLIRTIADRFCGRTFVVVSSDPKQGIPIGPGRYAWACDAVPQESSVIRLYVRKDESEAALPDSCPLIRIWHQEIGAEPFPIRDAALQPIGLFRMDIDNFRTYMLRRDSGGCDCAPPAKMELSKQLALFLRRDVPRLLRQYRQEQLAMGVQPVLSVIHEGADDIFIFGQLTHLIRFTGMMYRHYRRFTAWKISFSAGISIYDPKESFNANAQLAQQLLETAKKIPGKDGVVFRDGTQMYKWEEFIDNAPAY